MRLASMISLAVCLCVVWPAVGADNPVVVDLWPGKAPDETGNIGAEKFVMSPGEKWCQFIIPHGKMGGTRGTVYSGA